MYSAKKQSRAQARLWEGIDDGLWGLPEGKPQSRGVADNKTSAQPNKITIKISLEYRVREMMDNESQDHNDDSKDADYRKEN